MTLITMDWQASLLMVAGLAAVLLTVGWILCDDNRCSRLVDLIRACRSQNGKLRRIDRKDR